MSKVIKANFGGWKTDITDITTVEYMDGSSGLRCSIWDSDMEDFVENEVLSINLSGYGLHAEDGNVFIKDYSEHEGLTASLVEAGVVEIVRKVTFGPFNTTAFEVEVRL